MSQSFLSVAYVTYSVRFNGVFCLKTKKIYKHIIKREREKDRQRKSLISKRSKDFTEFFFFNDIKGACDIHIYGNKLDISNKPLTIATSYLIIYESTNTNNGRLDYNADKIKICIPGILINLKIRKKTIFSGGIVLVRIRLPRGQNPSCADRRTRTIPLPFNALIRLIIPIRFR